MKDFEVRKIVLKKFYEERGDESKKYFPKQEDFPDIEIGTVYRACKQLHEQGLLSVWKPIGSPVAQGFGIISSKGVDNMEGNTELQHPVSITNNHQNIKVGDISGANNLVIGNNNALSIESNIKELIEVINKIHAPIDEKASALKLLRDFVSHPLVTAVVGASISLFSDDLS